MRKFAALCLVLALGLMARAEDDVTADYAKTTVVKLGDPAPMLAGKDSTGADWSLASASGKVVVVNFFATWCGPCMKEIPHLEKQVWQGFKDKGLVLVSIGRDHSVAEMAAFKAKMQLSYTVVADPGKSLYSLYATKYIPRSFVIGKDGKLKYLMNGFGERDIAALIEVIKTELAR